MASKTSEPDSSLTDQLIAADLPPIPPMLIGSVLAAVIVHLDTGAPPDPAPAPDTAGDAGAAAEAAPAETS